MPITPETLDLAGAMRVNIGLRADQATRAIVKSWAEAWSQLQPEWRAAIDDLVASSTNGQWPSRRQIARAERAQDALNASRRALQGLGRQAGVTITEQIAPLTSEASRWQQRITASQYPPEAGNTRQIVLGLQRVDEEALEAIVRRSTQQINALTRPLSSEAMAAMRASLQRGVALGENPRVAARRMLQQTEGLFNGGMHRAVTIATTEMLDAHRASAFATDQVNSDVLAGWIWIAELDSRTCPSCWSQHGSVHGVQDPGPLDHQRGRCARVPKTRSWADLGFPGLDEPADLVEDGETLFRRLSPDAQSAIMGPERLKLLNTGEVSWGDLSTLRPSDAWRSSYAPTAVRDLAKVRV